MLLSEKLNQVIIGQPRASQVIEDSLIVGLAGLIKTRQPVNTLLFLGPTGTGKTSIIEELARIVHGDPNKFIKINCGDYTLEHQVARIIGAPPGHVGSDKPPIITQQKIDQYKSEHCPITLVLFDEFDKAHESFQSPLLSILDGELHVNSGKKVVTFSDCLVFLTANTGATELLEKISTGGIGLTKETKDYDKAFKKAFTKSVRPEIFNRIGEVVVFNTLKEDDYKSILQSKLDRLQNELKQSTGKLFRIKLDDDTMQYFITNGFSHAYGARELQRIIYRLLLLPISKCWLLNKFKKNKVISLKLTGNPPTLFINDEEYK